MTRKVFVFNFISCYLPLFLTAFVYLPFGCLIVPHLNIFGLTVTNDQKGQQTPKHGFQINSARLQKQVFYFALQAQVLSLVMEIFVPYLKRSGFNRVKKIKSSIAATRGGEKPDVGMNDPSEEVDFLAGVRKEAELDIYDVNVDLREMCMQVRSPRPGSTIGNALTLSLVWLFDFVLRCVATIWFHLSNQQLGRTSLRRHQNLFRNATPCPLAGRQHRPLA